MGIGEGGGDGCEGEDKRCDRNPGDGGGVGGQISSGGARGVAGAVVMVRESLISEVIMMADVVR